MTRRGGLAHRSAARRGAPARGRGHTHVPGEQAGARGVAQQLGNHGALHGEELLDAVFAEVSDQAESRGK